MTVSELYFCSNAAGDLLSGAGGSLAESTLGDDGCMWRLAGRQLSKHPVRGYRATHSIVIVFHDGLFLALQISTIH